jgi:hypothetical protein
MGLDLSTIKNPKKELKTANSHLKCTQGLQMILSFGRNLITGQLE